MSNLKDVNLQVASFSMKRVENAIENYNKDNKEYKTLVKKMSMLIQKNGFINTLAFNLSKIDENHHAEVIKDMMDWVNTDYKLKNIAKKLFNNSECKQLKGQSYKNAKKSSKYITKEDQELIYRFVKNLTNGDNNSLTTSEYRLLTKEMMILFNWMKRFVDSMIGDDK